MKYRKKPVVIDAMQLTWGNWNAICVFVTPPYFGGGFNPDGKNDVVGLRINTLEGVMEAIQDDWIIKGVNGEFYPCKPDIFEKTYEPAESPVEAAAKEIKLVELAEPPGAETMKWIKASLLKAAMRNAEINYAKAPKQAESDAAYIQSVSYYSFIQGANWQKYNEQGQEEWETAYNKYVKDTWDDVMADSSLTFIKYAEKHYTLIKKQP